MKYMYIYGYLNIIQYEFASHCKHILKTFTIACIIKVCILYPVFSILNNKIFPCFWKNELYVWQAVIFRLLMCPIVCLTISHIPASTVSNCMFDNQSYSSSYCAQLSPPIALLIPNFTSFHPYSDLSFVFTSIKILIFHLFSHLYSKWKTLVNKYLIFLYTLCFIGSPCCSVSYSNYISTWSYEIVIHWKASYEDITLNSNI